MVNVSALLIMKALDGLTARSEAIAHNIANAQSPGFAPVRVRFEDALAASAKSGRRAIASVNPQIVADAPGSLRLDLETADASATAGRYAALVDILNREFQVRALATSGGR